jgi:hypothetical protein
MLPALQPLKSCNFLCSRHLSSAGGALRDCSSYQPTSELAGRDGRSKRKIGHGAAMAAAPNPATRRCLWPRPTAVEHRVVPRCKSSRQSQEEYDGCEQIGMRGQAMAGRASQGSTWGFPQTLCKNNGHPGRELNLGGGEGSRYRVQHAWWGHGSTPARFFTRVRRRFGVLVGLRRNLRRRAYLWVCGGEPDARSED